MTPAPSATAAGSDASGAGETCCQPVQTPPAFVRVQSPSDVPQLDSLSLNRNRAWTVPSGCDSSPRVPTNVTLPWTVSPRRER